MNEASSAELAHAAEIGVRIIDVQAERLRVCAIADPTLIGHWPRADFLSIRPPFDRQEVVGMRWVKVGTYTPLA